MSAACVNTRRGFGAWLLRKWEALQVALIVKWAEDDRAHLAQQIDQGPRRLRQMDRDLEALRVRLAVLRS